MREHRAIVVLLGACLGAGCGGTSRHAGAEDSSGGSSTGSSAGTSGDSSGGSSTGSSGTAGAHSSLIGGQGGASGSEGEGGSAGNPGPEAAAGTGGSGGAPPWGPRSIVIVNETQEPRYLSMRSGRWDFFTAEDAGGSPCDLFRPWCSTPCDEIANTSSCLLLCEATLEVRALSAGDTVTFDWDGTVLDMRHDYCEDGGSCFVGIQPKSESYSLRVTVYDQYDGDEGTVFSQSGVLYPAEVSGDSRVYETVMRADQAGDVVIAITE